ncbi:MAG TPA: flagellar biosynthesis protein FlhB [Rhizomicrobium sp.]|nr:flagellar biosynthesis protein FlhB [Rhizomicrobium sp.]
MAEDRDDAQQTEEPTQRKLEEAHKQGDVVQSTEVTTFLVLGAGTLAIALFGHAAVTGFARYFTVFLQQPDQFVADPSNVMTLLKTVMIGMFVVVAPTIGLLMAIALGSNLIQHRFVFSTQRLKPSFSKINPWSGLKRMFGFEGMLNLVKGLLKIGVVGSVLWIVLWPQRAILPGLLGLSPQEMTAVMIALLMKVMIAALSVLAVIAAADYFLQKYRFTKRHRMSKQEIKEEFRQSDGDPAIKAKIRQIRTERARRRMMAEVPNATVVIMNPTHYAVALKYETGQMAAPICVAKGVDALALRIRATAEEHGVPVIENPPLARALHAAVEVDDPVPAEHFKAVAQVIGYVMRLTGKLRPN